MALCGSMKEIKTNGRCKRVYPLGIFFDIAYSSFALRTLLVLFVSDAALKILELLVFSQQPVILLCQAL